MTANDVPLSSVSPASGSPSDLRIDVGDLLHRVGVRRAVHRSAVVTGLGARGVGVPEGEAVDLDLRLEVVAAGIVVSGHVSGRWVAECSRCLDSVEGPFALQVRELYEADPVVGETYLLDGVVVDLEPVVRDTVLLDIPAVPLCDDDCRGLCPECGVDRNRVDCDCVVEVRDPRWAALDELEFGDP